MTSCPNRDSKKTYATQPFPPAVIITGGGTPGALDLVRSLRMEGIRSCVMSSERRDIGFFSWACERRVLLPRFEAANYSRILEILQEYVRGCSEPPVLFYASDPELKFVWTCRRELQSLVRFLLPPDEVFECLLNKVQFARLAAKHNLPAPHAVLCRHSGDVRAKMKEISFPCIVKPAFSEHWDWQTEDLRRRYGSYKSALRKIRSERELLDFCEHLPARQEGFVIQRYVNGRDESIYSFHGYLDESSKCLASFVGQKIRTYPMHTGGSAYIRTVHHQRLSDLSVAILRKLKFRGIVKIDFKLRRDSGEFQILEINSRYNLWELLGAYAGVNLAAVAFRHQRGEKVNGPLPYRQDSRLLYFKQDIRAFVQGYRKTGEWNLVSYSKSLRASKCYRVWDPADPLPFIVSTAGFLARNLRRLFLRFVPFGITFVHTLEIRKQPEIGRAGTPQPFRVHQR